MLQEHRWGRGRWRACRCGARRADKWMDPGQVPKVETTGPGPYWSRAGRLCLSARCLGPRACGGDGEGLAEDDLRTYTVC